MISYLLTGPAEEPVSLAEARAFLRLDGTEEDGLVETLVAAARVHVETVTGRAMLAQTWRAVLDDWPDAGRLRLPLGPVRAVTDIRVFDETDDDHVVALDGLRILPDSVVLPVVALPVLRGTLAVEIDYVAGEGTVAEVPADLRHAVLVLVAFWFENRDLTFVEGRAVPPGFEQLLAGYSRVRL